MKEGKIRQLRYFSAVPLLTFGILLLAVPSFTVQTISTVLGSIFSILGLVEMFLFLTEEKLRYRLILGLAGTLLGTLFITVYTELIVLLLQLAIGGLIIADGMYKIRLSFELMARRARLWPIPLLISAAMVILAVVVIFWPATGAFLPKLIGIALIVNSVGELLIGLYRGSYRGEDGRRRRPPAGNRYQK